MVATGIRARPLARLHRPDQGATIRAWLGDDKVDRSGAGLPPLTPMAISVVAPFVADSTVLGAAE